VVAYGNNDVLYLAFSGIRSIRSREVSGTPYANDIGNPIDSLIRDKLDEAGGREYYNAFSVVDPLDGRFWCAIYDTIYVLSHYPDKRIVAWSVYPMPAKILGMVATSESVFVQLAGGDIYQYGGEWGDTYPAAGAADVTVRFPYLTAGKPAHEKALMGLDIMAEGVWSVEVRLNPEDDSVVTGPLRTQRLFTGLTRIPLAGRTTHFAPVLTASHGGQVTLSSLTIHYTTGEAE
jgi:hypothetical protein